MLLHYLVKFKRSKYNTNSAQITIKPSRFTHIQSVIDTVTESVKNIHFTCIQVYRCMCHLLIADRVLYLLAGQHSHTKHVTVVSGAGNTTVYNSARANSLDINPVDHTICGIALQHVYHSCVFKMSNKLMQHLLDVWYDREQSRYSYLYSAYKSKSH